MANYCLIILKIILIILNLMVIIPLSFALTSTQLFSLEIAAIFVLISANYVIAIIGVVNEHLITIIVTNCVTTIILFIELLKLYPTFVFYYFVFLMIFSFIYITTIIICRTYYSLSSQRRTSATMVVVYRPPHPPPPHYSMPIYEPTIDSLAIDENKSLPPPYQEDRPPLYEDCIENY
ncbi:unnamed protein product [Medioppia subpectinata]|uniref:Uncharacterized protein n=1 Tax=Medioppia subpectinata TaxID=1979941 RepID=A0A7R9PVD7_9ACAR|nr:unnamed protein product [Medioppia subpectinata]CAG2102523.1 unnamed protein product [Medioppia subpectinata]